MENRKNLLMKSVIVLDRWTLMASTTFWSTAAIGNSRMLLRGNATGSAVNIFLCGVESLLGFLLFLKGCARQRGFSLRAAMIAVATIILWFQADPWLHLNDYVLPYHGSFSGELIRQRIVQAGVFACFAVPFAAVEFLQFRNRDFSFQPDNIMSYRSLLSLYFISVIPLVGVVVVKAIDGPIERLVENSIVVIVVTTVVLFELSRRSVQFNCNVSGCLAIVALGAPLMVATLF